MASRTMAGRLAVVAALMACASPAPGGKHERSASRSGVASAAASAEVVGARPAATNTWDPASTHAVIAGVLSWQDPGLTRFDPTHRKDQELHDLLRDERGVPADHMALLLDRDATKKATLARLERAAREAPASGTLLFYYAGHGVRADDGTIYFASWDIDTARVADTGLSMPEIEAAIATGPKGLRVILMADCCFSGALREVAERLSLSGKPAVSVTSADVSNTSTRNWTFSQAAIDAMRGDSLTDRDADGSVEVGELAAEVGDAMKFREKQRAGFAPRGVPETFVLARAAGGPRFGERAGAFALGDYALVTRGGGAEIARVRSRSSDAGRVGVRLYRYADADDVEVAVSDLSAVGFTRRPKDAEIVVLWGGRTWAARVLATDGDFHLITYPGWPAYWDEWILSDRIAAPGTPISAR